MAQKDLRLVGLVEPDPADDVEPLEEARGDATFGKLEELSEIVEDVERARAELGLCEKRLRESELGHAASLQKLADAERDNRRLQKELGQLIDRVFEQDERVGDDKVLELRREVGCLRQDNARLQDERDEARSETSALEEQLRRQWAEMDTVARDLDAAREEAGELGDLRREHLALEMQHADLQRLTDDLRGQLRGLRDQGGSFESYEREMAIARELLDGLERQCQRAESRAATYKTELFELRASNAELRKHLSALARKVAAGSWGDGSRGDHSKR